MNKQVKKGRKNLEMSLFLSEIGLEFHRAGAKRLGKNPKELIYERENCSKEDLLTKVKIYEKWREQS